MKTPKLLVLYSPIPPPPFLFIYKCSTCKFYIPDFDCLVVCRRGEPDLNRINPNSWCILWMNKPDEAPFDYMKR